MRIELEPDCLCDENFLCQQPACVTERAEEEARWFAMFTAEPDPIAYTTADLRADRVYGEQPYKYEDII